jgi:hypothetical protein
LFWPAIGIAPDSCARVIESLDRPAAPPGPGVELADACADSAEGTDVSPARAGDPPDGIWTGAICGTGGSTRPWPHALSNSSRQDRHRADCVNGVRIPLLSK